MPADVILIGGGGHARVVIDALRKCGANLLGVCDPALAPGTGLLGAPGLGDDAALERYDQSKVLLVNGIGSVGDPTLRIAVYRRLITAGWRFFTLVHPAAVVGAECILAPGVQVMAGAILQPGTRVGENAIVNTAASVDHDCRIGAHAHIAPGAVLCGDVVIGEATHIGSRAVVVQGITVGAHIKVGAGAVVAANLTDGSRVGPGQIVRKDT